MGEVCRWIYLDPFPSPAPSLPPYLPGGLPPSPASLHSIEADQRSKITLGRYTSKNEFY